MGKLNKSKSESESDDEEARGLDQPQPVENTNANPETPESILTDEEDKADPLIETEAEESRAEVPPSVTTRRGRIKQLLKSKKFWLSTSVVVLALVAAGVFVEPVKFTLLGLVSKGHAEFVIVDSTTLTPVESAAISVGGKTGKTGKDGKLKIHGLTYGQTSYSIKKENYKTITGKVKVRPGGVFVGPVKFLSQGIPVKVTVVNKLSKEAIKGFVIKIDKTEVSAVSDQNGVAILKVPSSKTGTITLLVTAEGYNQLQQNTIIKPEGSLPLALELVAEGKHYFLSNRSGKMAVFAANLDGSGQQEIITGTNTDADAQLSIAPDGKHAVLVSTRDNQKGPDGGILPALYAIDLEQKTIKRIDEGAPAFSIIGWANNSQVIYRLSYEDYQKADNTKIKLADVSTYKLETLHAQQEYMTTYFYEEDPGHVYFVNYDQRVELYGLISIDVRSKAKRRLLNDPSYDLRQTRPNIVHFAYDNKWYQLDLRAQQVKPAAAPSEPARYLTVSPNEQSIAWVESRDGKGTIIIANKDGGDQKQITRGVDATYIVHWLASDYIIYSVQTSNESAHYIVHIPSGNTTKISDVYSGNRRY